MFFSKEGLEFSRNR